jgi:hypothetical protein
MSQIILNKRVSPAAPAANKVAVYVKSDGQLYLKRENGVEERVTGRATVKIEPRFISAQEAQEKKIRLSNLPLEPENISLIVGYGGGPQIKGIGFELDGLDPQILYWDGKELDGFIEEGDVFLLHYLIIV